MVRVRVRVRVRFCRGVTLRHAGRPLRERDLGLLLLLLLLGLRAREHGDALRTRVGEQLCVHARVLLVGDDVEDLAVARADAGQPARQGELGLALLPGVGLGLG